jgi:polyvinyl alcohol dehydrogenase (cytochrome)
VRIRCGVERHPLRRDDLAGIAGTVAEGGNCRLAFHGGFTVVDARTGRILAHTYTIPRDRWKKGYAGASMWSTISIDTSTGYGYVGTGNPFDYQKEYKTANAIAKIDMNPHRATFGQVVDSYKGNVDRYFPQQLATCKGAAIPALECGNLDLDFGAAPNIMRTGNRTLVGDGQKSGVYHVIDAATMKPVWTLQVGVPSAVGGIVGTAAYDGTNIYGSHTIAGYLWSATKSSGSVNWVAPVGDGAHWGEPVTLANGIIYIVDLRGFLDAYDAATGAPLLQQPMELGSGGSPTFSWGGTTVARHTVYASVGIGATSAGTMFSSAQMPDGFVIAYRPQL